MPANECIPWFEDADRITGQASASIVGKTFVVISGNEQSDGVPTVATAGAGAAALGVAAYDVASGATLPIISGNQIVPVTAGAALVAGDQVQSDASGRAIPLASGVALGKVMTAQGTVGQPAKIKLNL